MERLRDHMEAAIRERWHERPLLQQPARLERLHDKNLYERRTARAPLSPTRGRASTIRAVPVRDETLARNRLVAAQPNGPEREAYLDLQAAVLRRIDEDGFRVIGVTSPSKGSGKTLTSINLAISLATSADRPVMIIDFDLSSPQVHKLFDVDLTAGLEDHLFNGVPVADALFSPSIDNVTVLPARGSAREANSLIRSDRLASALGDIKREHSEMILVLDLPSLDRTSDGQAFEALADGLLLVVEDDVTEARDYRRALQSVSSQKLIGTVLNRVPTY